MVGLGHRKSDAFHHEAGEPHQWRTGGQSAENEKFHSHIGTSATGGRFIDRRTHKTPSQPVSISIAQDRTMYNPNAFRRTHDKILKAIGAKHIRFHDLRHTFATLSLKSGVDVKTLSGALGHYSAGFTLNTYTHATTQMKQDAADTIGGVISQQMR